MWVSCWRGVHQSNVKGRRKKRQKLSERLSLYRVGSRVSWFQLLYCCPLTLSSVPFLPHSHPLHRTHSSAIKFQQRTVHSNPLDDVLGCRTVASLSPSPCLLTCLPRRPRLCQLRP